MYFDEDFINKSFQILSLCKLKDKCKESEAFCFWLNHEIRNYLYSNFKFIILKGFKFFNSNDSLEFYLLKFP